MVDETTNTNVQEQSEQNTNQNYIEALKNLKSSTVSKDLYQQALDENKRLVESLVNGQSISTETDEPEKADLKELKKALFKPDHELNDIEYVERTLELRKAILETTGNDIFVAQNHFTAPTESDYASAERVADVLQQCLEDSNGNNGRFIASLQSRMNDVYLPRRK